MVPSLFFISSEDWLSFKERIDEKFFKSVLKELETSSLRDAEAGLEIAVTQFNPQKPWDKNKLLDMLILAGHSISQKEGMIPVTTSKGHRL